MESITFSDTSTQQVFSSPEEKDGSNKVALSFEEYCKRHPDSVNCLEYDV